MRFDWDDAKDAANRDKHGIGLAAVAEFDFATAITARDLRRDYGEPRWQSIGFIGDRLHVVVYTWRGDTVRVISLRRANRREGARYERA